jgi:hypothetical protein
MALTEQHQDRPQHTTDARPRTATVVHDGSAAQLADDLQSHDFEVVEEPLRFSSDAYDPPGQLAVIAARAGEQDGDRLRERTRQLCWSGATILAIGGAVRPVAELFGSTANIVMPKHEGARVARVGTASQGLFVDLPTELRISLPGGARYEAAELSAELSATAWSQDGELISASHVFRPVHLLHGGALENTVVWPLLLRNLLRLVHDRGGRAF